MRRSSARQLPSAPLEWDPASREVWNQLIKALEESILFDKGRRTRPAYIIKGVVSAPVTVDLANPDVAVLTQQVGKLLLALQHSNFLDVREGL